MIRPFHLVNYHSCSMHAGVISTLMLLFKKIFQLINLLAYFYRKNAENTYAECSGELGSMFPSYVYLSEEMQVLAMLTAWPRDCSCCLLCFQHQAASALTTASYCRDTWYRSSFLWWRLVPTCHSLTVKFYERA